MPDEPRLGRRAFLRGGVAASVGALGLVGRGRATEASPADAAPRIRRYGKLGRTGLEISDICMGTGGAFDADLVHYAFERGVTTFDTAESYPLGTGGLAERALGAALRDRRDRVVLTTKTEAKARHGRKRLMRRLEGSLRRLQTDYVDVYLNHAVNEPARLRNAEWFEFVERAKRQGKIRFAGMSGHGGRLLECLELGLEHDLLDVILVAYNFGTDPAFYERFTRSFDIVANQQGLPALLARAHARGVGVMVMKTRLGGKLNDLSAFSWGGATASQAAFRWVLSNRDVDGLVVTMQKREEVDEFLAASGQTRPALSDRPALRRYLAEQGDQLCRRGCSLCESSCPAGVSISGVLRARLYATGYGDPARARGAYADLDHPASACLSCSGAPCASACPYGIDIPSLTRTTPELLG